MYPVKLRLVGCFGFNGPLRQYFSLYRAVKLRGNRLVFYRYKMADELAAMMNTELKRVIRFVKSIPGWREIPMEDQVFLIKGILPSRHMTSI